MEQHPVPRNVTGFKFQLVGSMTLRQFLYLVFGCVIAFIIYKSTFLTFFRYPLAGFFVFVGIAFAFLPIQDRPLEVWIKNLLVSIYSPTQFLWQKQLAIPLYLSDNKVTFDLARFSHKQAPESSQQHTNQLLNQYLDKVNSYQQSLDVSQKQSLGSITNILSGTQPISIAQPPSPSFAQQKQPVNSTPALSDSQPMHAQNKNNLPMGTIAGIVKNGPTVVPNVLIQVFDERGNAVRMLKTSPAGTFSSTLPLSQGTYRLEVEDPSQHHQFAPFKFTVQNVPFQPWRIEAISHQNQPS